MVYSLDEEPLLLQTASGIIIPYLYAIWKYDLDIPTFHTHDNVLRRFVSGADFMAPGIIVPPGGLDSRIQRQKAVMIKVNYSVRFGTDCRRTRYPKRKIIFGCNQGGSGLKLGRAWLST